MKHLLCLREFHYPFKTSLLIQILILLFFANQSLSQGLDFQINEPEEVIVCQSSLNELIIFNRSSTDLSNIALKLILPKGVEYQPGSVTGATEANITLLSAPEFTIASLLKSDSIKIRVQLKTNCDLFEGFNLGDTLLNKWIVKSSIETDSILSKQPYKIIAPLLVIDPIPDTNVVTGAKFNRNIRIRNTGLGSLKEFIFEDQHNSLEIGSASGTLLNQTDILLKIRLDASDFIKIGNRDSLFDRDESIIVTENIRQTSCEVEDIRSFFLIYWGCEMDTCQTKTLTAVIHFKQRDERALLKFSKESPYPSCICSDKGTPQCLFIENIGNQIAENIEIILYAIDPIPAKAFNNYGILRGSVFATGAAAIIDTQYSVHVEPDPDSCKSDQGYTVCTIKLTDLSPGEEVKITFNYMTCFTCAPRGNLFWYYDYSFNSKCVIGSTKKGFKLAAEMVNPTNMSVRNDIKDAEGVLEDEKIYTVQNYITLPVKIDTQYLIVEYIIPCPLRLIDTAFLLNGKAPFYRKIEDADTTIYVFLVYAPPFNESLYGEFNIRPDCNYICRLDVSEASNTLFYSSCQNPQLYISKLLGRICIKARLTCPDREYDCGQCREAYTDFSLKCPDFKTEKDSVYSYLAGSAEAYRKNYGGPDPNDDRFIDLGTLDTSQAERKTFITGDTLVNDFRTSVVIDDDRYYYDSIIFMITPDPLMAFDTIYSEIEIKDISTDSTYTCIYPISENYIINQVVPNCEELIVARIQFGSGFFVPFTVEQLNMYGAKIPTDFKFENGDSINVKMICRIHNFIGDKIQDIKITYRAFLFDRSNISNNPFSCMTIIDTIHQATLRINFQHDDDTLLICKSGFELFNASIRGSKQLENLFNHEFRKLYSLDSIKINSPNPNLFSNLIIDSFRITYRYQTATSSLLIKTETFPARLGNNGWEIDPELLKEFKFDESYTIEITPYGHLADCAKFKTSTNRIFSSYYVNGNDGAVFLDPNIANTLTNSVVLSNSNTVFLFNGNSQLSLSPFIFSSNNKITWQGTISNLQLPGGFEFEILSKNHLSNINIQSGPDVKITKIDSFLFEVKNLASMKNYQFNFSANYLSCEKDTILIISRWLCDGDSLKIKDQCNLDTFTIIIFTDPPFLQLDRMQETKESVLCDTLPEISLEIYNADKGTAYGVYLDVFIPPGTDMISSSLLYSYPKGSPYQLLPTPISLGSNRYRWIFENFIQSIKQDGLPGINEAPKNSIQIKMKLITSCNAVVNNYPRFIINGKNYCGEPTNSPSQPGKLIQIKGLSTPGAFNLTLQNQDLEACAEETTLRISIVKNNTNNLMDSLKIILPGGLHYKPNSIVNIKNTLSGEPRIQNEPGNESLFFALDSIQSGDSIVFSIKVNGLGTIRCSNQLVLAFTYNQTETICSASQDSCNVLIESGADEIIIDQKTGSMSLDSFSITRHADSVNYNLKFNYQLKDKSLIADSLICVNLFEDVNSNNKLDPSDLLIGNYQLHLNIILQDGSYPFESKIDKSKINSCNYLLASCPDNCICLHDTLVFGLNMLEVFSFKQSLCAGTSSRIGFSPADPGKKYKWTEGTVPCDTCSEVIIEFLTSTDTVYNYTLHEIDADGCFSEYKYQITVSIPPDAGADTSLLCAILPGGTVILSGNGNGTWISPSGNPGSVLITDPTSVVTEIKNFNNPGVYQFIRTNSNSCSDTVRILVTAKPNAGPDQNISCVLIPGGTISVTATGNGNWTEQTGNPGSSIITNPASSNTNITSFSQAGTYNYIWTNADGCADTTSIVVSPKADPGTIKLDPDSTRFVVEPGDTVKFCIIGGRVIRWEPDIGLSCNDCPCVEITAEGDSTNYIVTVLDSFDCEHILQFAILVAPINCDTSEIFIPNAFSPNNDNVNDIWWVHCPEINNIPYINKMHLGVYNRWGQKVFESFDVLNGWDGTFKGELLPPDVYGYFLEAECIGGKSFFMKGNVSLMK